MSLLKIDTFSGYELGNLAKIAAECLNVPDSTLLTYQARKEFFNNERERAEQTAKQFRWLSYKIKAIPSFESWRKTQQPLTPDELQNMYAKSLELFEVQAQNQIWLDLMNKLYRESVSYPVAEEVANNHVYVDPNPDRKRLNHTHFERFVDGKWKTTLLTPSHRLSDAANKLYAGWRETSHKDDVFLRGYNYAVSKAEMLQPRLKMLAANNYSLKEVAKIISTSPTITEAILPELVMYESLRFYGNEVKALKAEQTQHSNFIKSIKIDTGLGYRTTTEFIRQKAKAEAWIRLNLFSQTNEDLMEFFQKRNEEYSQFIKELPKAWSDVTQAKSDHLDIFAMEVKKLGYDWREIDTYDKLIKVLDAKDYDFNEILTLLGVTIKDPFLQLWKDMITRVTGKKEPIEPFKIFNAKVVPVQDVKPLPQNIDEPLRAERDPSHLEPKPPEQISLPQVNPITAEVRDVNDVKDLSQKNFEQPQDAETAIIHDQPMKSETAQPTENPIPETVKDSSAIIKLNQKDFNKSRLDEKTELTDEQPETPTEQPNDLGRVSGGKIPVVTKDASDLIPLTQKAFDTPLKDQNVSKQQTDKTSEAKDYPQSTIDDWIVQYAKMGLNPDEIMTRLTQGSDGVNFGDNTDLWLGHIRNLVADSKPKPETPNDNSQSQGAVQT